MTALNDTHAPGRRSWVAGANTGATDFPLQNLPLGLFRAADGSPRPCTAIGGQVLDIAAALDLRLLAGAAAEAARLACTGATLNALIAAGQPAASALRAGLSALLGNDSSAGRNAAALAAKLLIPQPAAPMLLPVAIGGFTDFFCSIVHAERTGRVMRPDSPLPPAFKHLPIAYNGRASSIAVSGADLVRPHVQRGVSGSGAVFGPSIALDYELELGAYLVGGNPIGRPLTMAESADQLFGYTLLNDWSARDAQRWESLPLGPFLGKSLLTSVAPWIVTHEALAPFRRPAAPRPPGDPAPLPHLDAVPNQTSGALGITLEAWLHPGTPDAQPDLLSRTGFAAMYWTFAQMVAHHASNGCNLRPGDLIGSGTTSDLSPHGRGCLLEMQSERGFLRDGDTVVLRGRATAESAVPIGFGECRGLVLPATAFP